MPEPPFPSLTKTWHTASYPAISPSRPELSAKGKTVVITGGVSGSILFGANIRSQQDLRGPLHDPKLTSIAQGTGIGANTARAFAAAGSTQIVILGRTVSPLEETARNLESTFPKLKVLAIPTDLTKKDQVDGAFELIKSTFNHVDVLVSNAGFLHTPSAIHDTETEEAWWSFEVHVRGTVHVIQAFKKVMAQEGAVVVDVSSIVAVLPAYPMAGAYTASKMAGTKLWEYFGVENPKTRVVSIQPGNIYTAMAIKLGSKGLDDSKITPLIPFFWHNIITPRRRTMLMRCS